jgi:hypothetical protein
MRTITLLCSAFMLAATTLEAQTVATFEPLSLAHADTFYTNYTSSGNDVGFNDGLAHFPCVYDTSFGGFWSSGFAYSNMTDSITSGYTNGYSAKAAGGYNGSTKYAVAYGQDNVIKLTGTAPGHPVKGFYVTNNTYAYNSMRDGDFFARAFHNGDWFKLTIHGYLHGALKTDSVSYYLADFLYPNPADNYILKTWEWVDLLPLGNVDSLQFGLTSTDNGTFGMNTPAYFCIDNFTTYESKDTSTVTPPTSVSSTTQQTIKVYPNPAANTLYVDVADNTQKELIITNMAGEVVSSETTASSHIALNTASYPAGAYVLQIRANGQLATIHFTKQ